MQKIVIVILCVCLCVGCVTGRNAVHDNGSGATETREHLDSLRGAQSKSAAASASLDEQLKTAGEQSAELRAEITDSADNIEKLERAITGGTDDIAELKRIVDRIRKRSETNTVGTE